MENSVGKPAAAREGDAPNVSTGKRVWRTPITHFREKKRRGKRVNKKKKENYVKNTTN